MRFRPIEKVLREVTDFGSVSDTQAPPHRRPREYRGAEKYAGMLPEGKSDISQWNRGDDSLGDI
ncbi:MAG: hypothetical protein VYA34_02255 [Myxococcota bacterium]|nr:hypothetical protein [Myxococcota bacterium]